jgi:hypothetical protein
MAVEPIATKSRGCVRSVRDLDGDRDADDDPAAALQTGGAVLEALEAKRARALAEDPRNPGTGLGPR